MRRPFGSLVFTALDFETTGLSPSAGHRVLEIGAVKFTKDFPEISTMEALVYPDRIIPEDVIRVHGITNEDVMGRPPIGDHLAALEAYLTDTDYLVIQNAPFEFSFLVSEFKRHGYNTDHIPPAIDTLIMSRHLLRTLPGHRLEDLCHYYQVPHGGHRALGDARSARDVFLHMVEQTAWPMTEEQDLLLLLETLKSSPTTVPQ